MVSYFDILLVIMTEMSVQILIPNPKNLQDMGLLEISQNYIKCLINDIPRPTNFKLDLLYNIE